MSPVRVGGTVAALACWFMFRSRPVIVAEPVVPGAVTNHWKVPVIAPAVSARDLQSCNRAVNGGKPNSGAVSNRSSPPIVTVPLGVDVKLPNAKLLLTEASF